MEKSASLTELTKALIKVQAALKPAVRDKDNPYLKTKYADLACLWESCRALLQENRLAVIQVSGLDASGAYLETILTQESGEWISGRYPLKPLRESDPQALGSAVTYARRYSLAALLGIVTEDDDAEIAMGRPTVVHEKIRPVEERYPEVFAKRMATPEQLSRIETYQKAGKSIKNIVDVYKWRVTKLSDLTFDWADTILRELSRSPSCPCEVPEPPRSKLESDTRGNGGKNA